MQKDLFVLDHNCEPQKISRHETSDGKESLGVHLAPDGNERVQFDVMKKKATEWTLKSLERNAILIFLVFLGICFSSPEIKFLSKILEYFKHSSR